MWLYKISWKSLIEAFDGWKPQNVSYEHFSPIVMIYKQSLQVEDSEIYPKGSQGELDVVKGEVLFSFWDFYLNLGMPGHTRRNL